MSRLARTVTVCVVAAWFSTSARYAVAAVDPWADSVVSYDYDGNGDPSDDGTTYNNPLVALGQPARMTGVAAGWPGVVSMFNGPWEDSQVVSVGPGGHMVLGFAEPVIDDPVNLYGVDLIVFSNTMFEDAAWPNGQLDVPAGMRSEPGLIELSSDGQSWYLVPDVFADALFPTQGYLHSGPYDTVPGSVPSDFRKPVNPALSLSDFDGLSYAGALALYDGSGGGTPVDISSVGLSQVSYVRITVPAGEEYAVEIDAMAVVPEPASLLLLVGALGGAIVKRWA